MHASMRRFHSVLRLAFHCSEYLEHRQEESKHKGSHYQSKETKELYTTKDREKNHYCGHLRPSPDNERLQDIVHHTDHENTDKDETDSLHVCSLKQKKGARRQPDDGGSEHRDERHERHDAA